jgi:hypothetical protein
VIFALSRKGFPAQFGVEALQDERRMNPWLSVDRGSGKRITLFLLAIAFASCICGAIPTSRAVSNSPFLGNPTASNLIRAGNFNSPAGASYTWIGTVVNTDWTNPLNWSPVRALPAATDILIFGGGTPSPIVTNVAGAIAGTNETIAELHIASGVSPTFSTGGANTLTINAGLGVTGFDVSSLAISGSNALRIELAPGTVGSVTGFMSVTGAGHRLMSNDPSGITFQNNSIFTTSTGFGGNAFGDGSAGNGAAGSIVFAAGSAYFHNAGGSPFGASGNASVVTFQTGSEADYLTATGFDASGRTYANLIIGNASTAVNASASGTGNFQFDNLTINAAGSNNSSLTFSGSGTSAITIRGDITSNGAGTGTLPDVTLTPGSGGIVINKPGGGTITFGNDLSNSRSIDFESNASVDANTALTLSRVLQLGFINPNNKTLTVNGTLNGGAGAYVIGTVLKTFSNSVTSNIFQVGTPNGYSPLDVSGVSGTGSLTINANQSQQPNITGNALKRYWKIASSGGITNADLTFHYLAGDVVGTESNYKIFKYNGSFTQFNPNVLNTTSHFATLNNVTSFSDWTLAASPGTPSVAPATTNEDTQTSSGLVVTKNAADGAEVTHFKITSITGGTLFQNNGTTQINNDDFITVAQGGAGLKFTPTPNSNASGSFQVQSSTDAVGTILSPGAATATITITPIADTPSVTNATTSEDTQTAAGLVISRNPVDGAEVTHFKIIGITGGTLFQNNGTTQINDGDFILAADGLAGLKFTPALNLFSPSSTFSFAIQASTSNVGGGLGGNTVNATITVNPLNDAPELNAIGDLTINEDAALQAVNLSGISAGGGESQTLTITATSNNTGVIPDPTVSYTSPNASGSLTFTPVANANGSAVITVTANDHGGTANGGVEAVTRTFTVTVDAVNDVPSFTKGSDQVANGSVPQTVPGWATSISAGPADEVAQILTFLVANNNNAIFSVQPSLSPSGTLTYSPAYGFDGTATVTVQLKDDGGSARGGVDTSAAQTFTITVHAVNNAPTLDALGNLNLNTDAPLQTVSLSGITSGPIYESSQSLTVTATSNNPALIPNPSVSYTSPNTTGSISFTPVPDASGSALITVTVKDDGGTLNGGVDTFSRTLTVTVDPINDAPVNSVPGSQNATLNATLVFSAANANLISISDVDAGSDPVQVTLRATDGTLTLSTTTGLSFAAGDGTGDQLMTFTGSIASINAALNGMGNLAFGSGVIEITTNDLGHNGVGGALSDTDTIQVTVIDNLAPTLLTAAGSDRAIALDSVTLVRDPIALLGDHNFSSDHRTRIMLFALHAQLKPGETAAAVTAEADDSGTIIPLTVESVRTVPNFDWLTQVVVRFPTQFSTGGGGGADVRVRISLRGANSNQAVITIVPAPPGP